jgi:hypothetical protein
MHATTGPDLARMDQPGSRAGGLARRIAASLRYRNQHAAGIGCIITTGTPGAAVWDRAPGTGLPDRVPR